MSPLIYPNCDDLFIIYFDFLPIQASWNNNQLIVVHVVIKQCHFYVIQNKSVFSLIKLSLKLF